MQRNEDIATYPEASLTKLSADKKNVVFDFSC